MRHRFDSHRRIFIHTLDGALTFDQFKAEHRRCYDAADPGTLERVCWELGEHRLLWPYLAIETPDLAFSQWLAERRPRGRTAFVTTLETNRVLLRQLRGAHHWSTLWAFFDDSATALDWLTQTSDS
jgi:hypothetical protein